MAGMIGNYQHSMDAKGRLFLPAKHRENLSQTVYMTYGFEECIMLFGEEEWNTFEKAINDIPFPQGDAAIRYFIGNSSCVEVDGQGRIAIPQNLRKYAGLEKEVTFAGLGRRIEIWNTGKWNDVNVSADKDSIRQLLGSINFKF